MNSDAQFFQMIAAIYGGIALLGGVLALIKYLFTAIGLYKMSVTLETSCPWLSFIPVANTYALGRVAEHYDNGKKHARYSVLLLTLEVCMLVVFAVNAYFIVLTILSIVNSYGGFEGLYEGLYDYYYYDYMSYGFDGAASQVVSYLIPMVLFSIAGMALSIVYIVFYFIALYRVYKLFNPENAVAFLVVSILVNITTPFFLFAIRNRTPVYGGMPPYGYAPYGAPYTPAPPQYPSYGAPYAQTPPQYNGATAPQPPYNAPQSPYNAQAPQYGNPAAPNAQAPQNNAPYAPGQYGTAPQAQNPAQPDASAGEPQNSTAESEDPWNK